jgi:SAM-dependent methyltransferase
MYRRWRLKRLARRLLAGIGVRGAGLGAPGIYGYQWGDPDTRESLVAFKSRFLLPYVDDSGDAVEIGPGGGRWTRYLLGFRRVYAVDYYDELLAELRRNVEAPNVVFVKNNGADFPGIPERSATYVFSFGTFVHLERDVIEHYLRNIAAILEPGGNVVIQYSDKTKQAARDNAEFSDNTPEQMREMLLRNGYRVLEEDLTSFGHSAVVRCTV